MKFEIGRVYIVKLNTVYEIDFGEPEERDDVDHLRKNVVKFLVTQDYEGIEREENTRGWFKTLSDKRLLEYSPVILKSSFDFAVPIEEWETIMEEFFESN